MEVEGGGGEMQRTMEIDVEIANMNGIDYR